MFPEHPILLLTQFLKKILGIRKRSFRLIPPRQPPSHPLVYQTQDSPFFNLPREVRDLIYHHYWTEHACLSASRVSDTNPSCMRPHYEGRNAQDDPKIRKPSFRWQSYRMCCPSLLLVSKQVIHEALEQYVRRAEWYWSPTMRPGVWGLPLGLQLDMAKVCKETIWTGDFQTCESLLLIRSGCPLKRLRISGYAGPVQWSHTDFGDVTYFGDATFIAEKFLSGYGRESESTLELEIFDTEKNWRRRVVYEVRREGSDVYLTTLNVEKRGIRVAQGREGWTWMSEEGVRIESEHDDVDVSLSKPIPPSGNTSWWAKKRTERRTEIVGGGNGAPRDELLEAK
jgi:hypothetical protein